MGFLEIIVAAIIMGIIIYFLEKKYKIHAAYRYYTKLRVAVKISAVFSFLSFGVINFLHLNAWYWSYIQLVLLLPFCFYMWIRNDRNGGYLNKKEEKKEEDKLDFCYFCGKDLDEGNICPHCGRQIEK